MQGFRLLLNGQDGHPSLKVWAGAMLPEIAAGILAAAGHDLALLMKGSKVKALAREMSAGKWLANGETLIFLDDGTLADGKCRLAACCLSQVPFPVLVVQGIACDALVTIGMQRRRSSTDTMQVAGVERAKEKHAVAGVFMAIARGSLDSLNSGRSLPPLLIDQVFDMHPGLADSLDVTRTLKVKRLTSQLLSAFHYAFSRVDSRKADAFVGHLGNHRSRNPAAGALKRALGDLEGANTHLRRPAVALLVKAWNAFCCADEIVELTFEEDEEMPAIWGDPVMEVPAARPDAEPIPLDEAVAKSLDAVEGYAGVSVKLETIMPSSASRLINERNGPASSGTNRPMSLKKVAAYARDQRGGRWPVNGQMVKFSKTGRLIDGQHRLKACVDTNVPLVTLTVFGLDDAVFPTLDGGATRNVKSILREKGVVDVAIYERVLGVLAKYDDGTLGQNGAIVTPSDLMEALDRHREAIDRSVSGAQWDREYASAVVSVPLAHAAHVILSYKDRGLADWYMSRIVNNDGLVSGETDWRVHRELTLGAAARRSKGIMSEKATLATIFEGWNRICAGQTKHSGDFKEVVKGPLPLPVDAPGKAA